MKTPEINSYYSIFIGTFKYKKDSINIEKKTGYETWWNRIEKKETKLIKENLKYNYYDNFVNSIFPEVNNPEAKLIHLTNSELLKEQKLFSLDNKIYGTFNYFDIFLFPNDIGMFCFKVSIVNVKITLEIISTLINKLRNLNTILNINDKQTTLLNFINDKLFLKFNLKNNWFEYIPKLKTYTQITFSDTNIDKEFMENTLFEIANVSPIGSVKGNYVYSPTKEYFENQLSSMKISVFKNWIALPLFDTFTRISIGYEDKYNLWENQYFNIYIHSLYTKYFLYYTNSELSKKTKLSVYAINLKTKFYKFQRDNGLTHISYSFLPNLIYSKILQSLDIQNEIENMEFKISRINEIIEERNNKKLNVILSIITILSVFSVINDMSQWFEKIGVPIVFLYPLGSISIFLLIVISMSIIFIIINRKK